jgi:hypothetical protein
MKMDDCAECHKKETARIERTNLKTPVTRFIDNIIAISFPGMEPSTDKGDSVQTEKDACFVCHK